MAMDAPLALFISSSMNELVDERKAVQQALAQYRMKGWLWEKDAGARPETVRTTYLKAVEGCDLYIGLFWLKYGASTIEEYESARGHDKPCLVYEKHVEMGQRDPRLREFLEKIGKVDAAEDKGLTICRFTTVTELANRVQDDVQRLLTEDFREKNRRLATPNQPAVQMTAQYGGFAIGINQGKAIQQNFGKTYPVNEPEDEETG